MCGQVSACIPNHTAYASARSDYVRERGILTALLPLRTSDNAITVIKTIIDAEMDSKDVNRQPNPCILRR